MSLIQCSDHGDAIGGGNIILWKSAMDGDGVLYRCMSERAPCKGCIAGVPIKVK